MDLNQITVPAIDVAASVEFYKQLGLLLIVDSVPRYARFECPDGNSTLSVERVENLAGGPGIVIYFECEQLDAAVDSLKAKGIVIDSDPVNQSWLWREARLRDPAGNSIYLYYAGENRKNPPWRLNAATQPDHK
jgi:catechol 2,3-dioxygenase-like lactoylglutathione lyase family enzyme